MSYVIFFSCSWLVIISFIYRWIFLSTFLFIKMIMQLAPSWVTTSPWCRAHHLNYNFHNMFSGLMTNSKSKLKILPMIFFFFFGRNLSPHESWQLMHHAVFFLGAGMHHTVKIVFHTSGSLSTAVISICLHVIQ